MAARVTQGLALQSSVWCCALLFSGVLKCGYATWLILAPGCMPTGRPLVGLQENRFWRVESPGGETILLTVMDTSTLPPNPSPSTSTQSLKRARTSDTVTEPSKGRSIAPKFLVVRLKNGDIQKLSPFLISKALSGVCGGLPMVSKPRAGGILVECRSSDQSRRLLSAKQLGEHPITVEAHKTLNSSRGVVFS